MDGDTPQFLIKEIFIHALFPPCTFILFVLPLFSCLPLSKYVGPTGERLALFVVDLTKSADGMSFAYSTDPMLFVEAAGEMFEKGWAT